MRIVLALGASDRGLEHGELPFELRLRVAMLVVMPLELELGGQTVLPMLSFECLGPAALIDELGLEDGAAALKIAYLGREFEVLGERRRVLASLLSSVVISHCPGEVRGERRLGVEKLSMLATVSVKEASSIAVQVLGDKLRSLERIVQLTGDLSFRFASLLDLVPQRRDFLL